MSWLFLKAEITLGESQGIAVIFAMRNVLRFYKYQLNHYRPITATEALIRAELLNYELI